MISWIEGRHLLPAWAGESTNDLSAVWAASRHLLLLVLPAALSAGAQAFGSRVAELSPQDSLRLAFAL